jgi:hypothetical protein
MKCSVRYPNRVSRVRENSLTTVVVNKNSTDSVSDENECMFPSVSNVPETVEHR